MLPVRKVRTFKARVKHGLSTRAATDTLFVKCEITRLTMAVRERVFSKSTTMEKQLKNCKTISTESRYDVSFLKTVIF